MTAKSPPLAQDARRSCLSRLWTSLWRSFVVLNLLLIICSSSLILYDADTFWITPIMPDANSFTACDRNYVCQALRGFLNMYCFAALFLSSSFLYTFLKFPYYVRERDCDTISGFANSTLTKKRKTDLAAVHSSLSLCRKSWSSSGVWYVLLPLMNDLLLNLSPFAAPNGMDTDGMRTPLCSSNYALKPHLLEQYHASIHLYIRRYIHPRAHYRNQR